jgi:hypothetical protein
LRASLHCESPAAQEPTERGCEEEREVDRAHCAAAAATTGPGPSFVGVISDVQLSAHEGKPSVAASA